MVRRILYILIFPIFCLAQTEQFYFAPTKDSTVLKDCGGNLLDSTDKICVWDIFTRKNGYGVTMEPTILCPGQNDEWYEAGKWSYAANFAQGPNRATGNYSTVRAGTENLASGNYSACLGGWRDTCTGDYAVMVGSYDANCTGFLGFVGNGTRHNCSGVFGTVLNGFENAATGTYSVVTNGSKCLATNHATFIGSGEDHLCNGYMGAIVGGSRNTCSGNQSIVCTGDMNLALGTRSFVGAGDNNAARGGHSVVGSGQFNEAWPSFAFIGSGSQNKIWNTSLSSAIVGGDQNQIFQVHSFIGAGQLNRIFTNGGYNGIVGGQENYINGFQSFIGTGYQDSVTSNNSSVIGSYHLGNAYGYVGFGVAPVKFWTGQNGTTHQWTNILENLGNGEAVPGNTSSARITLKNGWTQINTIESFAKTQVQVTPKAALEIVSTSSGFIAPCMTLSQRDAIWNESSQSGNFTATFTKSLANSTTPGGLLMDQVGMQVHVTQDADNNSRTYILSWVSSQNKYLWQATY
ncbi:MAG TPA: hypothetical protein PK006_12370 [Saprospiraceae bacterium]|nr:hypothetical protein [Saprospiraceae bacterium]